MTKALYRHDLPFHSPTREVTMKVLSEKAREASPKDWTSLLADSSLTLTSKDRSRIVKIDSTNVYTLDVRQPDGTYRSSRFPCKTVGEAWDMASQVLRVHRSKYAIN